MVRVELEAFRDEPTGELGLKLRKAVAHEEMYAATDGRLMAHDILEHQNGAEEIGDIGDELEALGAIWWIRGQHGDLNRDGSGSMYSIEENIASDVSQMCVKAMQSGEMVSEPRTARVRDDVHEEAIQEIARLGIKGAREEWKYSGDAPFDEEDAATFRRAAVARMRVGLRKARRRFPDSSAACELFHHMAEKVGRVIKHGGAWGELIEGARFVLRYDVARCEVRISQLIETDYGQYTEEDC
jgi:hypothetical protein